MAGKKIEKLEVVCQVPVRVTKGLHLRQHYASGEGEGLEFDVTFCLGGSGMIVEFKGAGHETDKDGHIELKGQYLVSTHDLVQACMAVELERRTAPGRV